MMPETMKARTVSTDQLEPIADDLVEAVEMLRRADVRIQKSSAGCLGRTEVAKLHELVGVSIGRLKALGVPIAELP